VGSASSDTEPHPHHPRPTHTLALGESPAPPPCAQRPPARPTLTKWRPRMRTGQCWTPQCGSTAHGPGGHDDERRVPYAATSHGAARPSCKHLKPSTERLGNNSHHNQVGKLGQLLRDPRGHQPQRVVAAKHRYKPEKEREGARVGAAGGGRGACPPVRAPRRCTHHLGLTQHAPGLPSIELVMLARVAGMFTACRFWVPKSMADTPEEVSWPPSQSLKQRGGTQT
jgi:hypothetical protein